MKLAQIAKAEGASLFTPVYGRRYGDVSALNSSFDYFKAELDKIPGIKTSYQVIEITLIDFLLLFENASA